jgi:hypothetical protein
VIGPVNLDVEILHLGTKAYLNVDEVPKGGHTAFQIVRASHM